MDSIKKVGRNMWLVNGKVIGSDYDDTFDDTTEEGRADLIEVSRTARTSRCFPRGCDPLHAVLVKRDTIDPRSKFFMCGCPHLREFPEDVKAELRKYMPEHAGEF